MPFLAKSFMIPCLTICMSLFIQPGLFGFSKVIFDVYPPVHPVVSKQRPLGSDKPHKSCRTHLNKSKRKKKEGCRKYCETICVLPILQIKYNRLLTRGLTNDKTDAHTNPHMRTHSHTCTHSTHNLRTTQEHTRTSRMTAQPHLTQKNILGDSRPHVQIRLRTAEHS